MNPSPPGPHLRLLAGAAVGPYVRIAAAALRRARLNHHYPDARLLASHLEALGPDVHGGLYEHLEIDLRSGLPTYREWARVQTDHTYAAKALADLGPRPALADRAAARPGSIHGKQLLKHDYYRALAARSVAPLGSMDVALRRVDPAARTAWFHVVMDKLDASGAFVRYSIDLSQQASVWSRPMVALDAEHARHTETFSAIVYRLTALDAELSFVELAGRPGLAVERVVKGSIGPFYLDPAYAPPTLAAPLSVAADAGPPPLLASFSLDMAALDLAADRDNDPIDDPLGAHLSDAARQQYDEARRRYGYKVYRDRKLVASAALAEAARALCRRAGTRNVIRTLRGLS